jgi:hypothetical protein
MPVNSRILGKGAIKGKMPFHRYFFNRILTFIQNILMNQKLSEYHSGYRAFRSNLLQTLPLGENSDDFVFDNQMISQLIWFGYRLGEVSCPCRYNRDASSISFRRSVVYGIQVLKTSLLFRFSRWGWAQPRIFSPAGRRLLDGDSQGVGNKRSADGR